MADTISPERRSLNMTAIKSIDTKPEVYLRKLLFHNGFRYRKNYSGVFGHPDIFLPKYKVAIFVHGCYWHRHSGCQYAYMPKSRIEFWQKKLDDNVRRDKLVQETLEDQGIRCIVVWECTIKKMQKDSEIKQNRGTHGDSLLILDTSVSLSRKPPPLCETQAVGACHDNDQGGNKPCPALQITQR